MNKKQAARYIWLVNALSAHGLSETEVDILMRCERTLHRWGERECGDGSDWAIERDEVTGKPFNVYHGPGNSKRYPIHDLETAAYNRAITVCKRHGLTAFHQSDPRGCALYVLRPGDVPEGERADGFYTRGIAICID